MKKVIVMLLMAALIAPPGVMAETAEENTCGLFEIGDYIQLGKYFDEPILWRCVDIDENGMLVWSEKILDWTVFDHEGENGSNKRRNIYNEGYVLLYECPGAMIYSKVSNYWGDSLLRSILNSEAEAGEIVWLDGNTPPYYLDDYYSEQKGFLCSDNFTPTEKKVIKEVTQKTLLDVIDAEEADGGSDIGWGGFAYGDAMCFYDYSSEKGYIEEFQGFIENMYDKIYYENTTDKIFPIDVKQLWNIYQNRDILGENCLIRCPTQFAADQILSGDVTTETIKEYHLRTPYGYVRARAFDLYYRSCDFTLYVDMYNGKPTIQGNSAGIAWGVVPAFYINETAAEIISGSGSKDDPYIVDGKGEGKVKVCADGGRISFGTEPIIESGRVLAPLEELSAALRAEANWEEEENIVTLQKDGTLITMWADVTDYYVNGEKKTMDVPPRIGSENQVLVPIRAVCENFGAAVEWDNDMKMVTITLAE